MDGAKVYNIHEKRTRLFLFFIVNVYVKICVWLHQKGEQCELPPWKYQRDDGKPEADEKMMQELHKMNVQLTGIAVMMAFMMPRLAPGYMDRVTEIVDKLDKEVKQ